MAKKHNVPLKKVPTYLFHSKNESVKCYIGNPKDAFRIIDNVSNGIRSHTHEVITKDSNSKNQLKVIIIQMHGFFLDCLVSFLKTEGNFNVMTKHNLASAIKAIDTKGPFDLIIQNFEGPEFGPSKLDAFKQLLNYDGGQNVALMCGAECNSIDEEALKQEGIVGFIPRTMPLRNLIKVLQFIATGQRYAPPEFIIAENVRSRFSLAQRLSHREVQVLCGISRGQTNNSIACDLGLKESTIKLYAKNLFRKLHVANRTQAAIIAREHGIN